MPSPSAALLAASRLDDLHVDHPVLRHRITRLQRANPDRTPSYVQYAPRGFAPSRTAPRTLTQDFAMMRRIVRWIARRTSGHPIHILRLPHFLEGPPPCPYCLALSLWFFHTASARCSMYVERRINDYPFCQRTGDVEFFSACELYVVRPSEKTTYATGARCDAWFYRRGLELLFLSLLRGVFGWCERLENYRLTQDRAALRPAGDPPADSADHLYGTSLSGDELTFYYLRDHPLEAYRPPAIGAVAPRCRAYCRYHQDRSIDVIVPFHAEIRPDEFDDSAFLALHEQFGQFLVRLF